MQRHLTHGRYRHDIIKKKQHSFGRYIEEWLEKGVGIVGKIRTNTHSDLETPRSFPTMSSSKQEMAAEDNRASCQIHTLGQLDKYHLGVSGRKVSPPTDSKIDNKMSGAVGKFQWR